MERSGEYSFAMRRNKQQRLSCRTLSADESTLKVGIVSKTHRYALFSCFDKPVQRLLIIKGKYLLRYKVDKNGEAKGEPTGMPVKIIDGTFSVDENDKKTFIIESLFQTYSYTAASEQECNEWIYALESAKNNTPIEESDLVTNAAARKLVHQHIEEKEAEFGGAAMLSVVQPNLSYGMPNQASFSPTANPPVLETEEPILQATFRTTAKKNHVLDDSFVFRKELSYGYPSSKSNLGSNGYGTDLLAIKEDGDAQTIVTAS